MRTLLIFWGILFSCTSALFGQASTSSLQSEVTDASGAVIAGATVEVENATTGAKRSTGPGDNGRYILPQMAPGTYNVRAKSSGFADLTVASVQLLVNSPATLNLRFAKLADVAQTVDVEAQTEQLNTTDASLGNAFGTKPILQLPFNARNVAGLLSLRPGVTFLNDDPSDRRFEDDRNGTVNGARSDQSNVTLDGVDVNDQETRFAFTSVRRNTLDSVQEFRVTTTGANADQGSSSGVQVALVTRSGTNELHGSAYHFHRNTITSANDFFNNRSGVKRPKLIRNTFGTSASGPIRKNRLFIFGNFEGSRDASEQTMLSRVPAPSYCQGLVRYQNTAGGVSELTPDRLRQIDPLIIGINPQVAALTQTYPLPNDTTLGDGFNSAGYRFTSPTPLSWKTYIAKLDWLADQAGRHSFFLRGNLQDDSIEAAQYLPGQPACAVTPDNSKGLAAGYNHAFSPAFIGNFRFGFTRQGLETTGLQTRQSACLAVRPALRILAESNKQDMFYSLPQDFWRSSGRSGDHRMRNE